MHLRKNGIDIEVPDAQVVDLILERLNGSAAPTNLIVMTTPRLGDMWHGQAGHFVGSVFVPDANPYHLIVGPEMEDEADYKHGMDWAKGLSIDGHSDFDLPNRREGRFLQCQAKQLFKDKWYWLSEQHTGDRLSAWAQYFADGHQTGIRKACKLGVRAVRRIPIHQFNNSLI